jgi:hypothetical protein
MLVPESLGPVDEPNPPLNSAEKDEPEETAGGLVVANGDAPHFLEMADEAFDPRPKRI